MTNLQSRVLSGIKAKVDSYGGARAAVRKFGPLALLDAGLREAWLRIGSFSLRVLREDPLGKYGLLEALLFPTYDYWGRYQKVMSAVLRERGEGPLEILEVGSGRGGIALFLKPGAARVCMVDRAPDNVVPRHSVEARYLRADACHLPFRDASFGTVVSVDTLEHIPPIARRPFLRELKRVARDTVIVTCPLDSQDGRFQAGKTDAELREALRARERRVPNWLEEHLEHGHPTLEEVTGELEGAQIEGWQNCECWKRFEVLHLRKFLWPFGGLLYLLVLKKNNDRPPHWRGMVTWQKTGPKAPTQAGTETVTQNLFGGQMAHVGKSERDLIAEGKLIPRQTIANMAFNHVSRQV